MQHPFISPDNLGESLHRTLKLALDEDEVSSLEDAQALFDSYRLRVRVGTNIAASPTRQAMLLTVVNTAARCFLGGVQVEMAEDVPLLVPYRQFKELGGAVCDLGGEIVSQFSSADSPLLLIGDCPDSKSEISLRLSFQGWCGAVTPPEDNPLPETEEWTLTGVLAGALGVSEAFQAIRGKNIQSGQRPVALSLWKPELNPFTDPEAFGPPVSFLPAEAWVLGLGHLGQAYLWCLGLLPYAQSEEVQLVLQDTDCVQRSNLSTSVLSRESELGAMKTREMAQWCSERGFSARIHERLFADDFQVQPSEPKVALCGVDNPQARACLQDVGFTEIIEAGLGSQGEDYLSWRLHSFSKNAETRSAREIWGDYNVINKGFESSRVENSAYRDLEARGVPICGLITLAGRAVGASFVGTVVATFCIAEIIRQVLGGHRYALMEMNLRSPEHLKTKRLQRVSDEEGIRFTIAKNQKYPAQLESEDRPST